MKLELCTACRRHVRATESVCPFCGGALARTSELEEYAPSAFARGALMTLASASFAATLGACYGAPARQYEPLPPPQGDPQLVDGGADAHATARRAMDNARKQGCTVYEQGGGSADIVCADWSARAIPTTEGIQLYCRDPADNCRTGYDKLLVVEPTPPPIEPIPPPP